MFWFAWKLCKVCKSRFWIFQIPKKHTPLKIPTPTRAWWISFRLRLFAANFSSQWLMDVSSSCLSFTGLFFRCCNVLGDPLWSGFHKELCGLEEATTTSLIACSGKNDQHFPRGPWELPQEPTCPVCALVLALALLCQCQQSRNECNLLICWIIFCMALTG